MDSNSAREAFGDFLASGNLNADQIRFVDNIIYHLTRNGVIEKEMLFELPFTDINDMGVAGIFEEAEVLSLLRIVEVINNNSVA